MGIVQPISLLNKATASRKLDRTLRDKVLLVRLPFHLAFKPESLWMLLDSQTATRSGIAATLTHIVEAPRDKVLKLAKLVDIQEKTEYAAASMATG